MSSSLRWAALAAVMLATAAVAADQAGPGPGGPGGPRDTGAGPPPAPAKTVTVHMQLQASAANYKKWPSGGNTWHHGVGFIEPFGQGEYYCGENFPEAKQYPMSEALRDVYKQLTGRGDGLFCIYTVKQGSFYVYDSVAGTLENFADGGRNQMINVVVGGTGPFKGASGVWLGVTEGRGKATDVAPGRRLPEVLLKVMDGYVKLPLEAGQK